jgi:hypothetical protein
MSHEPSTATSEKLNRREWQGIVEDMASRGAMATSDELKEIARWLSYHCRNVRINQLSAREQEMEPPHDRTTNRRIGNFDTLKKTGVNLSKLEPYKESIVY